VAYLEEKLSQGVKGLLKNGVARRYLRIKGSKVSLDREKIKNDAQYDGKWVLLTTTSLPAEEVALSYKGLWQVEQAFRTLKSPLEIRPVYHWTERRVRGHVMACVLAYLLEGNRCEVARGQDRADGSGGPQGAFQVKGCRCGSGGNNLPLPYRAYG